MIVGIQYNSNTTYLSIDQKTKKSDIVNLIDGDSSSRKIFLLNGKILCADEETPLSNYNLNGATLEIIPLMCGGIMQVFLKSFNGKTCTIEVEPTDTIRQLKEIVEKNEAIPIDSQRLIFAGKELNNAATIHDSQIVPDSAIYLVVRLPGGNLA